MEVSIQASQKIPIRLLEISAELQSKIKQLYDNIAKYNIFVESVSNRFENEFKERQSQSLQLGIAYKKKYRQTVVKIKNTKVPIQNEIQDMINTLNKALKIIQKSLQNPSQDNVEMMIRNVNSYNQLLQQHYSDVLKHNEFVNNLKLQIIYYPQVTSKPINLVPEKEIMPLSPDSIRELESLILQNLNQPEESSLKQIDVLNQSFPKYVNYYISLKLFKDIMNPSRWTLDEIIVSTVDAMKIQLSSSDELFNKGLINYTIFENSNIVAENTENVTEPTDVEMATSSSSTNNIEIGEKPSKKRSNTSGIEEQGKKRSKISISIENVPLEMREVIQFQNLEFPEIDFTTFDINNVAHNGYGILLLLYLAILQKKQAIIVQLSLADKELIAANPLAQYMPAFVNLDDLNISSTPTSMTVFPLRDLLTFYNTQ